MEFGHRSGYRRRCEHDFEGQSINPAPEQHWKPYANLPIVQNTRLISFNPPMLTERPTAPLSPPTSPRMSETPGKATDYHWQPPSYLTTATQASREEGAHGYERQPQPQGQLSDEAHGQPRSYKSYPYSLGPSTRVSHDAPAGAEETTSETIPDQRLVPGSQATGSSKTQAATFGRSAPTSPNNRLTPRSGENAQHDEPMLDDIDEDEIDPAEGDDGVDKSKMTPAELRAHKRKMKRFRYFARFTCFVPTTNNF